MKKLFGVNTPLSCPMTESGKVDYKGIESLVNFLVDKGVDGLYPNGSTGEMCYLTLEERKKVLECVIKANAGRAQVFSMVGANTTADTIELAQHAEKAGADGVGIVTPYYFKLDDEELLKYFCDVSSSVSKDFSIYLYGIPQLAVNDISLGLAQRIAEKCPNVVGIKYSYPDMPRLLRFMNTRDGDFSVLAGPDDLFLSTLVAGGDGTISGTSNAIPEMFVAIYDAFKKGDMERAKKLQNKANKLIDCVSGPNNMSRYKECLKYRGVIKCTKLREPLRSITDREKDELFAKMEELGYKDTNV